MAELEIKIGADVAGAVKGLEQVQTELDQTGKSANALSNTVVKASGAFQKIPQSANQANSAITNLNRVVQDAPFGFIGIQNNIGPLVDSFGQLKMSTGSTGGALKALAGSLIGPAGIGLAVAAVSSAITFAIQGFSSWTRSTKAAKEENEKLAQSVALELVQLTSIVGLAQNVNASQADRSRALKLLNDEYGKYLPNLNQESISLTNINEKYQQIIDTMLRQAVVKGMQEEIAKQVAETAKKIIDLQLARERERLEIDKSNKVKNDSLAIDNRLKQIADQKNRAISDGVIAYERQTQAEKAAIGTTNVYDMMIQGLKDSLMKSLAPALNLTTAFTDLNKVLKASKDLKLDFTEFLAPQDIEVPLKFSDDPSDYKDSISPVGAILKNETKKYFERTEPLDGSLLLAVDEQKLKDKANKIAEDAKNAIVDSINSTLKNIQIEGLSSIGEAIGAALSGGDVGNAFKSFGSVLASGLEAIGKQLITIGGLAEITKEALKTLFTNPALAIATGIGLIAAATALKTSLSKGVGARALGGPVSGGTPYLVGERGPELFVPSVSGGIVPNNNVSSFMGGRMGSGGGSSVLRGQDILLAYARTQRSQLRVNG